MSIGIIDFRLSFDTDITQNKNKINLYKHHLCLNYGETTRAVDSVTPKLYFKNVVMPFINDSPTRTYAFDMCTDISVSIELIPLNIKLG